MPNNETYLGETISSLCASGQRPLLMTGALVQWLRQHFQKGTNLEDHELNLPGTEYIWTPNRETSRISIESYTRWDSALVENRPAIIVKRNAWQYVRLGINNRAQVAITQDGSSDYTNAWLGSHTLFVIAGEGAECEKLVAEVYREMNQFGPVMRRSLNLAKLQLAEIGDMKLLEEATENFVVPINIAYAFFEDWKLTVNAPTLKGSRINTNT